MDRCALFIDAGYALADGAMAVHGTRRRDSVSWDHAGLLKLLAGLARDRTGLPVLRCYWYEIAEGGRTAEHDALAEMPGLKLRLVNTRPGRREGIESQLRRDLVTLAKSGAIADAFIASADEHLAEIVSEVQDLGLRVVILHIASDGGWTVPQPLRQECDDIVEISGVHLRPFVELIRGAEPAPADEQLAGAHAPADGEGSLPGLLARNELAAALPAPAGAYAAPVGPDYGQTAQPYAAAPTGSYGVPAEAHAVAPPVHVGTHAAPVAPPPQRGAEFGDLAQAVAASQPGGAMLPGGELLAGGETQPGSRSQQGEPAQPGEHRVGQSQHAAQHAGAPHHAIQAQGIAHAAAHGQGFAQQADQAHGPQQPTVQGPVHPQSAADNQGLPQHGPQGGETAPHPGRAPGYPQHAVHGGGGAPQRAADGPGAHYGATGPAGNSSPVGGTSLTSPYGARVPAGYQEGPGRNGAHDLGGYQNGIAQGAAAPANGTLGNGLSIGGVPGGAVPGGISGLSGYQSGAPGGGNQQGGEFRGGYQNGVGESGDYQNGSRPHAEHHEASQRAAGQAGSAPQIPVHQGRGPQGPGQQGPGYAGATRQGTAGYHNGVAPMAPGQSHSLSGLQNVGSQNGLVPGGANRNGVALNGADASNGAGRNGTLAGGSGMNGGPQGGALTGMYRTPGFHGNGFPPAMPPGLDSAPGPGQGQQFYGASAPAGQEQHARQAYAQQFGPAPTFQQYPAQPQQAGFQLGPAAQSDPRLPVARSAQPAAISLPDAVKAAHSEGYSFGETVGRDAPGLWLEAVLARKPRMPSDLEARLLQGSVLPIDSLLHDEVRHSLRRGFWDALESARR